MKSYLGTEGRKIPFIVGAVDESGQWMNQDKHLDKES